MKNMDPPKELTEEQKVKQDLIKNLQKNLQNMERDQRTFIRLATLDKSKLPANLPPSSSSATNSTTHASPP